MMKTELEPYRTITARAARRQGLVGRIISVDKLHAVLPQDGSVTWYWEKIDTGIYGVVNLRATERGVEIISDPKAYAGGVVAVYPLGQGRKMTMLVNA